MFEWLKRYTRPTDSQPRLLQRGYSIYHISQLYPIAGEDKHGNIVSGYFEFPWFTLSPIERIDISKKSAFVFGMVTNRMNRIGSLDFKIVPDRKDEDRLASEIKIMYSMWKDFSSADSSEYIVAAAMLRQEIKKFLPDLLPDLSNFNRALVRWSRKLKLNDSEKCDEIEDFLSRPNKKDQWEDIVKKWVYDTMIHGAPNFYKKRNIYGDIISLHALPGGSVYPLRTRFVSNFDLYAQVVPGEPTQIFDSSEIIRDIYAPTSYNEYGIVPLDALVNKISEQLLSENYWAKQADGTQPPEKIVAIEERDGKFPGAPLLPMDPKEQKRIETSLNQYRRGAIRTITGTGPITVLDISKHDMLDGQLSRLAEIKKDIALVFNMTNIEINEAGSEGTSGRSTSESQERIERARGTYPIIKSIEDKVSQEFIKEKWGDGYRVRLMEAADERELLEIVKMKLDTGAYSVNKVLMEDLNEEPFDDPQFDVPQRAQPKVEEAINDLVMDSLPKKVLPPGSIMSGAGWDRRPK